MKAFMTLIALAGLLLAAQPSQAIPFTATLSGINEFPLPINVSPATGFATVDLDVIAHTLSVDITFSGLLAPNTAAHIHCCVSPSAPNPNTSIATMTPTFFGFPSGVTSGTYSYTFDTSLAFPFRAGFITANGGTPAGAEAALLAGLLAGEAYVNIHTSLYPGGEIRGFFSPSVVPDPNGTPNTNTVPEPGTLWLVGTGMAALAALRKKLPA